MLSVAGGENLKALEAYSVYYQIVKSTELIAAKIMAKLMVV